MKSLKITWSLILAILMSLSFVSCDDDDKDDDDSLLEGLWEQIDASYLDEEDRNETGLGGIEYYFDDNRFEARSSDYYSGIISYRMKATGSYSENGNILNLIVNHDERESFDEKGNLSSKVVTDINDEIARSVDYTYENGLVVKRDTTEEPRPINYSTLCKIDKLTKDELILINEDNDTIWFKRK